MFIVFNKILDYIEEKFTTIENDMNNRNSISKKKNLKPGKINNKTRKKRQELSVSAIKSIKKEKVEIVVKFE